MSKTKYIPGDDPKAYVSWKKANLDTLIDNWHGGVRTEEFADFVEAEHARFVRHHLDNESTPTP